MSEPQEDEPLDPAVEAVRVKMVRLLAVSGGIMMLGLMAVLFGIVYKINQAEPSKTIPSPVAKAVDLKIPKGARLTGSQVSGDTVVLTLQTRDGQSLIQVHQRDGKLISTYSVSEE